MSQTAKTLLAQVLSLPDKERAAFADALLSSLSPNMAATDDEEFSEELARRSREMDEDPDASISWEEFKKIR